MGLHGPTSQDENIIIVYTALALEALSFSISNAGIGNLVGLIFTDSRGKEEQHEKLGEEHKIQTHNTPGKNQFALNGPNHYHNRITRERPQGRIPRERSARKW
jgi:hypothetical protein